MTPGRWCLLVVIAVLVVVWLVWPEHSTDNPQYDALSAALTRNRLHEAAVKKEQLAALKENVIARRTYTEARKDYAAARSVTPPAFVLDTATIHINTETYTVQRPVVDLVKQLLADVGKADTLAKAADTALVKSDTAIAKTQVVVVAADARGDTADKVIAVLQEKPGFLSRVFARVRLPLVFVAGVLAAKAVR